jgi:hypothetical protein
MVLQTLIALLFSRPIPTEQPASEQPRSQPELRQPASEAT